MVRILFCRPQERGAGARLTASPRVRASRGWTGCRRDGRVESGVGAGLGCAHAAHGDSSAAGASLTYARSVVVWIGRIVSRAPVVDDQNEPADCGAGAG